MSDDGSGRNSPLSPYYPSETPDVPGEGRRWTALLLAALLLASACFGFLALLLPA